MMYKAQQGYTTWLGGKVQTPLKPEEFKGQRCPTGLKNSVQQSE